MDVPLGFEVALLEDLTRYASAARKGARGVLVEPPPWAVRSRFGSGHHVWVRFPDAARAAGHVTMEVEWPDLDVVDQRWVEAQAAARAALEDALANHVRRATLVLGPKGKFRRLDVEYDSDRPNDTFRRHSECKDMIDRLRATGKLEEKRDR